MSTETPSELEMFHGFLGQQLRDGTRDLSVEESVQAFRRYQQELQRFKTEIQPALAESQSGQSQPLDVEQIIARGMERAAKKGLSD